MSEPPTLPIPVQRRRRRRWPFVLGAVLIVLVLLGTVGANVGDRVFRQQAEVQIADTVEQNLPTGVSGQVRATIAGDWALQQYLSGRFDHVTLTSSRLRVANAPASAVVQLYGLPVRGGAVQRATAQLTVGQEAFRGLDALQQASASDPVLGDGTVTTTVSRTILGLSVKVKVVLTATLADQVVQLRTKDATLIAGPVSVPATAIVRQLLPDGVNVCAAQYLPQGVSLTELHPRAGAVTVGLAASDVDLERLDTTRTGRC